MSAKDSCKNIFRFWGTATPALSHQMGEGESSSVGQPIQPLWKLQKTGLAVPSPVGRERVRVRVVLFDIRLLFATCFCTNTKPHDVLPSTSRHFAEPLAPGASFLRAARSVALDSQMVQ